MQPEFNFTGQFEARLIDDKMKDYTVMNSAWKFLRVVSLFPANLGTSICNNGVVKSLRITLERLSER